MIVVRGVNLYPAAMDNVIRSIEAVIEYEVEVRRTDGMDDLLVKIETKDGPTREDVAHDLAGAFRRHFNIRVEVVSALPGSLPRYEFKARRYKRVN